MLCFTFLVHVPSISFAEIFVFYDLFKQGVLQLSEAGESLVFIQKAVGPQNHQLNAVGSLCFGDRLGKASNFQPFFNSENGLH